MQLILPHPPFEGSRESAVDADPTLGPAGLPDSLGEIITARDLRGAGMAPDALSRWPGIVTYHDSGEAYWLGRDVMAVLGELQ